MTKRQEATFLGEIFNSTMTSYIQDIQELNFETRFSKIFCPRRIINCKFHVE